MTVKISLLKKLDYYISTRSGGSHKELAEKLGISQATLTRQINKLKNLGAPIEYDRVLQRHYYAENGHLNIDIKFIAGRP